ncbi:twin-arginine translocase TatA/TatE family subunit [Streptomyces sp. NPDC098781]|uniref:twin-arginine translocase TatA/TatE family subunit n=1 Tax=Streptomyces sp. NPDC098781 TaxID=3366097 RepID=UPI003809D052
MFGLSEIAIILLVVVAVLCARKLPDLVRSAGRSTRILKAEAGATRDEDDRSVPRVIQGETVTKPEGTQPPQG